MLSAANPVILYDGVCGLCNRMVQFVLKRDKRDLFRFAPLQSEFARQVFEKHGRADTMMESVCLVEERGNPGERVLHRSTAIIAILRELGPFWRVLSILLSIVPGALRDWAYDFIARYRYGLFGRHDSCPLPSPEQTNRFLDIS